MTAYNEAPRDDGTRDLGSGAQDRRPERVRPSAVRVAVLGPVTVDTGAGPKPVAAPQQRRLLCLLAAAALEGRAVPAAELLDELYDGREGRSPRSAAATALWRLRASVGADVVIGGNSGYSLNRDLCQVDILEFEDLVNEGHGRLLAGDAAGAEERLGQALGMWHGKPLSDMSSVPAGRAVAVRLEEMRLGATEDRASALSAAGRGGEAIGLLAEITASHPSREHAWALLTETYAKEGHLSQARRVLDAANRYLAEQGLEPGSELKQVQLRISSLHPDEESEPIQVTPAAAEQLRVAAPTGNAQMIGREREVRVLLEAARQSLGTGDCRLLLIEGEAGIGKTALLAALGSTLGNDGAHVGRTSGDDRLELPYAALRPWMTQMEGCSPDEEVAQFLFGDPSATSNAQPSFHDPVGLREAIAAYLAGAASQRGPTVLLLDDAHLATASLLETLSVLIRHAPPVPLCVIAAVRYPEGSSTEVSPALRSFRRSASTTVRLGGLAVDAVREILVKSGLDDSLAGWVHEMTGGNPLFVTQVSQLDLDGVRASLGDTMPWVINDAIDSRIEALPPAVASVLRVASVIGAQIDERILVATAADVLDLGFLAVAEAVETAVEAGLLAPDPTSEHRSYLWVHSLVTGRLYHTNRAPLRAQIHASVGRALERLAPWVTPEPSVLAHHYSLGWPVCPVETAVRYLRDAGARSAAELDFDRAGAFFARALDLVALDPRRDQLNDTACALLELSARAANFSGDGAKARESYTRMAALGGAEWKLRAALGTVSSYVNERIAPRALDHLEAALVAAVTAPPQPSTELQASSPDGELLGDCLASLSLYRPGAAFDLASKLSGYPELEASALTRVWELQPVSVQVEIAARLVAHERADRNRAWLRSVVSGIAAGRGRLSDPVGPDTGPVGSGTPRREPARSAEAEIEMRFWRIAVVTASGDAAQAARLIADTHAYLQGIPDLARSTAYMANLAGQDNWLSFLSAEPQSLTKIQWPDPRLSVWHHAGDQSSAFIAARRGLTDQALATCERVVDDLLDGVLPEGNSLARIATLASACRASGYRRGMEVCLSHLEPHADEHVIFFLTVYWGSVRQRLGGLHLGLGNAEAAREQLELAVEEHDRVGARVLALWSRCDLAEALWRLGGRHRPEGERLWAESVPLAVKHGARAPTLRQWPPSPLPGAQ